MTRKSKREIERALEKMEERHGATDAGPNVEPIDLAPREAVEGLEMLWDYLYDEETEPYYTDLEEIAAEAGGETYPHGMMIAAFEIFDAYDWESWVDERVEAGQEFGLMDVCEIIYERFELEAQDDDTGAYNRSKNYAVRHLEEP